MTPKRYALLIGSNQFDDPAIKPLRCSECDVNGLGEILKSKEYGNFTEILKSINEPHYEVELKINELLNKAQADDLALIYFSGHGEQTRMGKLHLITKNTRENALVSTSIPIEWIKNCLTDISPTNRIIIILDCCHSGAAGDAFQFKGSVDTQYEQLSKGRGTYVLTASTSPDYALESTDSNDKNSVFTKFIIDGIKTWDAADENGNVSVDSLYKYLYRRMQKEIGRTPMKWDLDVEDELIIARSGRSNIKEEEAVAVKQKVESLPDKEFRSLMEQASDYTQQRDYDQALACYDKAIYINPTKSAPWIAKGQIFKNQEKYKIALMCFDQAITLKPGDADIWFEKGETLVAQKKEYREISGDGTKKIIQKYDRDTGIWSNTKTDWSREDALLCYSEAIRLNPDNILARKKKARYSKSQVALDLNNEILRRAPDDIETMENQLNLVYPYAEKYLMSMYYPLSIEQLEETIQVLEKIIDNNPRIYISWVVKGDCLFAIGGEEELYTAVTCYNQAIELDPNNPLAINRKLEVLKKLFEINGAQEYVFEAWKSAKGEAYAWYMKGYSLNYNGDDRSEAIRCWEKALEIKPNDADTWRCLGDRFYEIEKYDESLECYNEVILLDPNDKDAKDRIYRLVDHTYQRPISFL